MMVTSETQFSRRKTPLIYVFASLDALQGEAISHLVVETATSGYRPPRSDIILFRGSNG